MTIKQHGGVFGRNPTFNDVTATTVDTTTVDAERLNVTAGADSIAAWIQGRASDNAAAAFFTSNNGGTQYGYVFSSASEFGVSSIGARPLSLGAAGSTAMQIDTSGNANILNGNLIVANGKGIDFSATAGTGTSELFDDYEEGTWDGVFTDQTNNATMLGGYGTGLYTKTGRMVTVTGYFYASSLGSVSGNMYISGLPFANGSLNRNGASVAVGYGASLSLTAGQVITGVVEPSASVITLNLWDATGGTTNLQDTEFSSSGGLYISASYMTD